MYYQSNCIDIKLTESLKKSIQIWPKCIWGIDCDAKFAEKEFENHFMEVQVHSQDSKTIISSLNEDLKYRNMFEFWILSTEFCTKIKYELNKEFNFGFCTIIICLKKKPIQITTLSPILSSFGEIFFYAL